MTVLRIFHIPSQLSYVSKLAAPSFAPVPSPTGAPLTVAALLARDDWHFFDVLHVHTVELAADQELRVLAERLRAEDKGLVATVHDLAPNIETDQAAFDLKTGLLVEQATVVFTLTAAAADRIQARFGRRPEVVPHGYAVPPDEAGPVPAGLGDLLMFGALRPNRRLSAMVRAWRLLPAGRRPLRVVLRSVGPADRERSAADLAELAAAADTEPDLTVESTEGFLTSAELVERCRPASVLLLPYRGITHSGQLELARDLGLAVLLPDVPTVRAQLTEAGADHPCVWYPAGALDDPPAMAGYLARASDLPRGTDGRPDRHREHTALLERHRSAYRQARLREWVS